MPSGAEGIPDESLRQLHSQAIDRPDEIRALLARAQRQGTPLHSRLNAGLSAQAARIESLEADAMWLTTSGFDDEQPDQIFLNLEMDGRLYFFSVTNRSPNQPGANSLRVGLPGAVFFAERRERERERPVPGGPTRVMLRPELGPGIEAEIADQSPDGLLVTLPAPQAERLPERFRVAFVDGPGRGQERFGAVRHRRDVRERQGWKRIGLSTSAAPRDERLHIEVRDSILGEGRVSGVRRRLEMLRAGARAASVGQVRRWTGRASAPPAVQTVEFHDARGERLVGIVDHWGELRGAPLVLIPPAWAKTKETLLPLARTIVASFRAAGERVAVVRLDGIRRRGESHNDPECAAPGHECHHMTFGQGVSDIRATLAHFARDPDFQPSQVALVTFSGAAIEARKALVGEPRPKVDGWVSVVGAADLKTGLRVVSGGVDFIGGRERGVSFGIQRILGIEVDMDRVGDDALAGRMAYLEDACCDLASLDLPITWIQGRFDAWIDPARVRDMLASGDASRRRLIDVPTGHQLRSSKEALETFQLVAQELGRSLLGREIAPALPDLGELERRRKAERARLPEQEIDLKDFWRSYLLGRDEPLGMELLTVTRPYRELMDAQIDALAPAAGQRIADLGSGTGAFPLQLAARGKAPESLRIDAYDYVPEALERARARLESLEGPPEVAFFECDLDGADGLPAPAGAYDGLLASLLLNYVTKPARLLAECHRLLRPGGRLVLSTLRRDADISRIYTQVSRELHEGAASRHLGPEAERHIDAALREFLNEAARLIDFEERGIFQFWDAEELRDQVSQAGFEAVTTEAVFGDPPQAIVLSARRP
ncbi:MAG: class I SAM-dependent methyltransferase [Myxococcales bacterium]|nr:class I SAM-dependent methyltransferase [Myxococcales bacterium]